MVFVGIGDDELRDGDRVVLLSALNGAGIRAVSSSEDESASATLHMAPGIALASFVHQPDAVLVFTRMQAGHYSQWLHAYRYPSTGSARHKCAV